MSFTIQWKTWVTPARARFKSDEDYFEYRNKVSVCEICGQVFQDGEIWGIVPHTHQPEPNKHILEARVVHKPCYRKEQAQ